MIEFDLIYEFSHPIAKGFVKAIIGSVTQLGSYNKTLLRNQIGECRQGRSSVKFQKICVIGLGYIGLPTASTFAAHGVKVLGVDINQHIIDTLNKGEIHIHEPGLRDEVRKAHSIWQLHSSPQNPKRQMPSSSPCQLPFRKINLVNTTA